MENEKVRLLFWLTYPILTKYSRGQLQGQLDQFSQIKKPSQSFDLQRRITSNEKTMSCRGRIRTSTGQLAKVQSLVVNPGRPYQW